MLRFVFASLLLACPLFAQAPIASPPPLPPSSATTPFEFTIANIMRGPELYGRPPQQVAWSADNRWIYFRWVEPGADWRETPKAYRVRAVPGARPERVADAQMDTVGPLLASGVLSARRDRRVVEYQGDIFVMDERTGNVRRLTETVGREGDPRFSADGTRIFFVRDNNVFSMDVSGGSLRQHTDIRFGGAADSARRADSVRRVTQRGFLEAQQLELFEAIRDRARADSIRRVDSISLASRRLQPIFLGKNERISSMAVSPTASAMIVVLTSQADAQRRTIVPRYVTESGYTEELQPRTKVGDTQGRSRVGLVSLPSGRITWLRAFSGDTALGFTRAIGWNRGGTHALLFSRSFDNKTAIIQAVDASGQMTTVDVQRDTAWVGGPCFTCAGWYDEGRRVWFVSEADGFSHLYTARPDGSDERQLTSGRWEVHDVELSPDERSFYLHTNEPSPFEQHFYRMSVDGGARSRLTTWSGGHEVAVSRDQRWL
ncbi:MAG: DPP IV N-terminal domain-containing protein, partial [Gemmatimonadaceae bacterium]